jgi:hypothetical protein
VFLPLLQLHLYLTNGLADYERNWTFRQHLEHVKLTAIKKVNFDPSTSAVSNSWLTALELMSLVGKRDLAHYYGSVLRLEFADSEEYIGLLSVLQVTSLTQIVCWLKHLHEQTEVIEFLDRMPRLNYSVQHAVEFIDKKLWRSSIATILQHPFVDCLPALKRSFKANILLAGQLSLKYPFTYFPDADKWSTSISVDRYPEVFIAYRLLASFPKVVNVHDWFRAFQSVISGKHEMQSTVALKRFHTSYKQLLRFGVIRVNTREAVKSRATDIRMANFVERSMLEYV